MIDHHLKIYYWQPGEIGPPRISFLHELFITQLQIQDVAVKSVVPRLLLLYLLSSHILHILHLHFPPFFTILYSHLSPLWYPYPDSHFIQMLDKTFFQKINNRWNIFLILSQLMTFTCYCRFSEWSTQERKGKKIPSYMFLKYHKRNNVWISQPWIVRNCKAIV